MTVHFLSETMGARKWNDNFKVLKEKNSQPQIPYPVRISLRHDSRIKTFLDEGKLREAVTGRPILKEMEGSFSG